LVADLDSELPRGIVVSKGADVPEWINIGDKVIYNEQYVADISSDGTDYVSTNYKALLGREV
jgi:co-chaperonin GroES (HSP10)